MKFLLGRGGLPRFKTAALVDELGRAIGRTVRLESRDLLMLDVDPADWAEHEAGILQVLDAEPLDATGLTPFDLFIVPRRGIVSPWASKAADILVRCHIDGVRRIERGRWLRLDGVEVGELSADARQRLFDRMTEDTVDDVAALSDWFRPMAPEPLGRIALGDDPADALARANAEMGLALNHDEIGYLADAYAGMGAIQPTP